MAQLYGKSSEYLVDQKLKNKYSALWIVSLLFPLIIVYWLLLIFGVSSWISLIVLTISFLIIRKIANWFKVKIFKYKKGIQGEDSVLQELLRLPDEYIIFRNIHLPGVLGDIDFTVIGPTGIFILETKNVKGIIEFDGKELLSNGKLLESKSVISQVRNQYWGLHDYLLKTINENIFINPIIVFVYGNFKKSFDFQPIIEKVRVMDFRDLSRFFASAPYDPKYPYINVKKQLEILITN